MVEMTVVTMFQIIADVKLPDEPGEVSPRLSSLPHVDTEL